jgi:hypothetical protein
MDARAKGFEGQEMKMTLGEPRMTNRELVSYDTGNKDIGSIPDRRYLQNLQRGIRPLQ